MTERQSSKERRYHFLLSRHFTPLEAREFSVLRKETPALKEVIKDRGLRRARFEKIAARKIARGVWSRDIVQHKWMVNLSRMYSYHHWRVQQGPIGDQPPMPPGSPNPWALYRALERIAPPKKDVSPWQLRRVFGKTHLETGLVFIQKAERRGGISQSQVRLWISEKDNAIAKARGQHRYQLVAERDRLEKLLR